MIKPFDILKLRSTKSDEFMEILWTALNPDGVTGRTRDLLYDPMIKPYYENWGRPDDVGFAAVKDGKMVGAAWCRKKDCVTKLYQAYPELSIGVLTAYQNQGIGTQLMKTLIRACRKKYPGIRLGVNEKAVRVLSFYDTFGFSVYDHFHGSPQLQMTF